MKGFNFKSVDEFIKSDMVRFSIFSDETMICKYPEKVREGDDTYLYPVLKDYFYQGDRIHTNILDKDDEVELETEDLVHKEFNCMHGSYFHQSCVLFQSF